MTDEEPARYDYKCKYRTVDSHSAWCSHLRRKGDTCKVSMCPLEIAFYEKQKK